MKKLVLLLAMASMLCTVAQTQYTYTGKGNWADQNNWSPSYPGTTIAAADEVLIPAGAQVKVTYLTNHGKIINKGTLTSNSFFYNYGTLDNDSLFESQSFFYNYGTIDNDSVFFNRSFFNNQGITNNNRLFTNHSIVDNLGTIIDKGVFYNGAFFNGSNKVHQGNFVTTFGYFSAGPSTHPYTGRYIFNDNFTASNVYFTYDIGSLTQFDTTVVLGQATISGTLTINLLNDFEPSLGDSFVVLTAEQIVGTFGKLDAKELSGNKGYKVKYTEQSVVLEVVDKTLSANDYKVAENVLTVYPNPVSEVLHISGLTQEELVSIADLTGLTLKSYTLDPQNNTINIADLASGHYLVSIGGVYRPFVKN